MSKRSVVLLLLLIASSAPAQESPLAVEDLLDTSRARLEALRQSFDDLLSRAVKEFASENRFETDDSQKMARKLGQWVAVFPTPIVSAFENAKLPRTRGFLADVLAGARETRLAPLIIPLVGHENEGVRTHAIRILGTIPSKDVPAALVGVLESQAAAGEKAAALDALSLSSKGECAARVTPFLDSPDPVLRSAAVRALRVASPDKRKAAKRLVRAAIEDQDLGVRAEALRQLAHYPDDLDALKALHEAVTGDTSSLVDAALGALDVAAHKAYSKRYLKQASESAPSKELKERAARLLNARLGDPSGVRHLLSEQTGEADRRPRNAGMQSDMGDEFRRFGAYQDALEYYHKALNAFRNSREKPSQRVYVAMARCYARLGKFSDARKQLSRAGYRSLAPFAGDGDFAEMKTDRKYADDFKE